MVLTRVIYIVTVTNTTYINRESVVTLLERRAKDVSDRPITQVLDNARYQRHAYVMSEAVRLGHPTVAPHRRAQFQSHRTPGEICQSRRLTRTLRRHVCSVQRSHY